MKLGKGINYSRYCWQWRGTEALDFTDYMDPDGGNRDQISPARISEASTHVALINHLGFDTIRLPITFHRWTTPDTDQIGDDHRYWVVLDNMISACQANDLNLVISYHHAETTLDFARPMAMWQEIAQRESVRNASDKVVFEIFNEPNDIITNNQLRNNYISIINAIRTIPEHTNRWMVVGGNAWNDIGFGAQSGLTNFTPLNLPNIIYTFHSYEPKPFTNQGFKGEPCYQTKGISFPAKLPLPPYVSSADCTTGEGQFKYDNYAQDIEDGTGIGTGTGFGMGTVPFLIKRVNEAKAWSVKNGDVPLWCGEWGCHRSLVAIPDDGSIKRFIAGMLIALKAHDVDWCWWDFEGPFTMFDPVPDVVNLPDSFGVVTCTNDTLSPLIRKLMKLNRRS